MDRVGGSSGGFSIELQRTKFGVHFDTLEASFDAAGDSAKMEGASSRLEASTGRRADPALASSLREAVAPARGEGWSSVRVATHEPFRSPTVEYSGARGTFTSKLADAPESIRTALNGALKIGGESDGAIARVAMRLLNVLR
ncbi:MAG: hypothetical protein JWO69_157 [Thermoleophilia bacterium]|jgi:hypothetical protein|nr:hypothetical protein [Thermoleophilia bacterium]